MEAHGTGTKIGDPVEVEALSAVFCEGRPDDRPLRIGSGKANIGHLEAGAGVAGLIKAALSVHHGIIPRSIHADPLNAEIPWGERRVKVQQRTEAWPAGYPQRVAGVNSFGITGTNAHVVLSGAPARKPVEPPENGRLHVLPFSARDEVSLKQLASEWRSLLTNGTERLSDLCYTAGLRRTHYDHRVTILGRSKEEMAGRIGAWIDGISTEGVVSDRVTANLNSLMLKEMGDDSGAGEVLTDRIANLPEAEGREYVYRVVRQTVMRVLRIPEDRMDDHTSLQYLGLDSLMSVELANRIQLELGVALTVMKLLRGPTVEQLAAGLFLDLRDAGRQRAGLPGTAAPYRDSSGLSKSNPKSRGFSPITAAETM